MMLVWLLCPDRGDSKGMSYVRVENINIFETFSNCNHFYLRCILRIWKDMKGMPWVKKERHSKPTEAHCDYIEASMRRPKALASSQAPLCSICGCEKARQCQTFFLTRSHPKIPKSHLRSTVSKMLLNHTKPIPHLISLLYTHILEVTVILYMNSVSRESWLALSKACAGGKGLRSWLHKFCRLASQVSVYKLTKIAMIAMEFVFINQTNLRKNSCSVIRFRKRFREKVRGGSNGHKRSTLFDGSQTCFLRPPQYTCISWIPAIQSSTTRSSSFSSSCLRPTAWSVKWDHVKCKDRYG